MGTSAHVCVFHPDPVCSAGEKHVISAQPVGQGQTKNPTVDGVADADKKQRRPRCSKIHTHTTAKVCVCYTVVVEC